MIYIALFYIVGSVVGMLTFPPPDFTFELPGFARIGIERQVYTVPWTGMLAFVALVCVGLIIFLNLVNVEIAGTGLNIDSKYISTIIIGVIMSGFLGYTLVGAFPVDTPFMVTIMFAWIPIILLLYSMIYRAGAG